MLAQVLGASFLPSYESQRSVLIVLSRTAFAAVVLGRSSDYLEAKLARSLGYVDVNSVTWTTLHLLMWLTCALFLFFFEVWAPILGSCTFVRLKIFSTFSVRSFAC